MSSNGSSAVVDDDNEDMIHRLQLQAAHPLHHRHNHPLAFINSLDTLHRHFMISLQQFSDQSIPGLLFRSTGFFQCAACAAPSAAGPSFHCLACPFSVAAACVTAPLLTVEHHPHPLLLLNRNNPHHNRLDLHLICAACDEGIGSPSFVRCVHCDAFLHVHCALPPAIKVEQYHPHHPIRLISSPQVLVGGTRDFCSVCGEQRDVVSWVYSCQLCPFVAHVECVIYQHQVPSETETEEASMTSQLCTLALDDEHKEEEANDEDEERSHEINNMKPGLTLQQILDSFSESEDAEYQNLVSAMVNDAGGDDDDDETETNSEHKHLNHFSYLEKPLYDLLDRLDLGDDAAANPFEDFDRDSLTVLVDGRYLASEKLAGTFTRVLAKHGDISGTSNLSIKVKTIVWNLFCKVVDDMSRTEFENVTGELLVSWMIGIRSIQLAGFEVGFAFEWWKEMAMAFFGVQAKEITDELVSEMEEKIEEQKLKLENLCGEREKLLSLREKCLMEALAMEGKIAGDGLI